MKPASCKAHFPLERFFTFLSPAGFGLFLLTDKVDCHWGSDMVALRKKGGNLSGNLASGIFGRKTGGG